MKSPAEIASQRETDFDILAYVRGSQALAPVTQASVLAFLVHQRRRQVTGEMVSDRLHDLVDREALREHREWVAGEGAVSRYEIARKGRQILDGEVAPDA